MHSLSTAPHTGKVVDAAFEARYGEGVTELDALEALHPGELERILTPEILRYYDDTLDDQIDSVMSQVQRESAPSTPRCAAAMPRRSRG